MAYGTWTVEGTLWYFSWHIRPSATSLAHAAPTHYVLCSNHEVHYCCAVGVAEANGARAGPAAVCGLSASSLCTYRTHIPYPYLHESGMKASRRRYFFHCVTSTVSHPGTTFDFRGAEGEKSPSETGPDGPAAFQRPARGPRGPPGARLARRDTERVTSGGPHASPLPGSESATGGPLKRPSWDAGSTTKTNQKSCLHITPVTILVEI